MILPHIISIITHGKYQKSHQMQRQTLFVVLPTIVLINVLPALSKAIEKIIRKQITVHIKSNRMMSYLQSGFRAKYSTTTALLKVTDDVRKKASVNINPT
jgi:hypothetical protein